MRKADCHEILHSCRGSQRGLRGRHGQKRAWESKVLPQHSLHVYVLIVRLNKETIEAVDSEAALKKYKNNL